MTVDHEKVRRRVDLRQSLLEAASLVKEDHKASDQELKEASEWLVRHLNPPASQEDPPPAPNALIPMTEKEAKEFSSSIMPFGKDHKGSKVIDVPFRYLEWLDDQPDFRRNLRRYLDSTYYKRNHGNPEET